MSWAIDRNFTWISGTILDDQHLAVGQRQQELFRVTQVFHEHPWTSMNINIHTTIILEHMYGKPSWLDGWCSPAYRYRYTGCWFQRFHIFHNIYIWDNPSHWLSYFSRWLKPPNSIDRYYYIINKVHLYLYTGIIYLYLYYYFTSINIDRSITLGIFFYHPRSCSHCSPSPSSSSKKQAGGKGSGGRGDKNFYWSGNGGPCCDPRFDGFRWLFGGFNFSSKIWGILWDSKTIFEPTCWSSKLSWSIHSPIFRPSRYMVMLFWTILSYIISLLYI